jgi:hypothetical protein
VTVPVTLADYALAAEKGGRAAATRAEGAKGKQRNQARPEATDVSHDRQPAHVSDGSLPP